MFLSYYEFIYNWLFEGGLPMFLTIETAEWISFGLTSFFLLLGIFIILTPLWWFISKVFQWV